MHLPQSTIDQNCDTDILGYDLNSHTDFPISCNYLEDCNLNKIPTSLDDLNVMHWNVRGLINKQNLLSDILHRCMGNNLIHIVTLNETWLTRSNTHMIELPDYVYTGKCRTGKKGGGVGFLIHKSVYYRQKEMDLPQLKNLEYDVIEIKLQQKYLLVCSIYRPPNNKESDFLEDYYKLVRTLKKERDRELIIGIDSNLDLLKCDRHKRTQDFLDWNIEHQLFPSITKPTRIGKSSATLNDNIFLSTTLEANQDSHILINDISDHMPCLVILHDLQCAQKTDRKLQSRKLSKETYCKIKTELQEIDWTNKIGEMDVEQGFETFHDTLCKVIDKHAPLKTYTIPKKSYRKEPWMTKSILKSVSTKLKLYQKSIRKNATMQDKEKYKEYRNALQKVIRSAKIKYNHDKSVECKSNTKELWKHINTVIGKKTKREEKITLCTECPHAGS